MGRESAYAISVAKSPKVTRICFGVPDNVRVVVNKILLRKVVVLESQATPLSFFVLLKNNRSI